MNLKHTTLVAAALLAFGATVQAQAIDLSPAATAVAPGASFAVQVDGSGFTTATLGGGFDLQFDAAVLRLDSISFSPIWEFLTDPGTIDNIAGTASGAFFNSFVPKSGSFAVGTLNFTAVGAGTSSIVLGESASFPFSDAVGNVLKPGFGFASATVTAVPEPGSVAMMVAGLVGLVAARRRQRA